MELLTIGLIVGFMIGFICGMIYEDLTDTINIRNKKNSSYDDVENH